MLNEKASHVDGQVEAQCEHCRTWFYAERLTVFFCSTNCRVYHHRAKKKRIKDIADMQKMIEKVLSNLPRRGDSEEFIALQSSVTLIQSVLREVEA